MTGTAQSTPTRRGTRTGAATPLPSPLALGVARTWIEVKQFFRERDSVVFSFAYPVIMLGIFATVFGQDGARVGEAADGSGGVPFAQYFLPGMVATGIMLSSFQTLAITIAVERDEGGLKRLRGTPLPPSTYFLGKVGQVLVTTVLQMALLLAAATTLFGVPLPTQGDAWIRFAWVLLLGAATGAVTGVAFSSVPRSGRSASAVVVPIVLVLQFTSGVFFVYSELPVWMQRLAEVFPLKWLAQAMRSVFLPDAAQAWEVSGSWQLGTGAAVMGAWLVAALVIGARTFRWRRRDDG